MKYQVNVVKKIAFLIMTMALAMAMVACQGAVGPAGPAGPPAETPTTPATPATPATPTPAGPTVTVPIPDMALMPGGTRTVDLSTHFSGAIGYAVVSDMSDIASVPAIVSAGTTLTVTAGTKEGVAMVTVTASDSVDAATANTVADTFKVTVSSTVVTAVTIEGAGATKAKDIGFDAGETLHSNNGNVLTVKKKAAATTNTWTFTGVKKGTATVDVSDAAGKAVRSIAVTVKNTAPEVKADAAVADLYKLRVQVALTDRFYLGKQIRQYHELVLLADTVAVPLAALNVAGFFKDADSDSLSYSATSTTPYVVVKEVKETGIVVDVIKQEPPNTFDLMVYATDGDKDKSEAVTLTVAAAKPIPETYDVQQLENGAFTGVTAWERQGVNHTMEFEELLDTTTDAGFKFVVDWATKLKGAAANANAAPPLPDPGDHYDSGATNVVPWGSTVPTTAPTGTDPSDYQAFTIAVTGPISVSAPTIAFQDADSDPVSAGNQPTLNLKLSGNGTGKVTITYSVWSDLDGVAATKKTATWHSVSKTLTVTVRRGRS